MKKILALFILVSMYSCHLFEEKKETFLVGFSQCTSDDEWRQGMNREMLLEAFEHPEISLLVEDGNGSNQKQIQDIERFIAQGVDAIIVSPNESQALTSVVEKAFKAGIAIVLIDRKINSQNYSAFIGANNEEIGVQAGVLIKTVLNKTGRVVEIWGNKNSSPAQERHKGFLRGLGLHTDIVVLDELQGEWHRETAADLFKETLIRFDTIDLVYAHNDRMALGAYAEAKKLQREKDIIFIGIDGISVPNEGMQGVIDGKLLTSFLYPTGAEQGLKTVLKILNHEPYEKEIQLNTLKIDTTNVTVLKEQADDLIRRQRKIELQRFTIAEKFDQIETQRMVMLLLFVVILLVAAMAIVVLKGKKKISLQAKQLSNFNTELQERQYEIEQQAYTVQHQNEYIMSGIKYAKTIQQSILPIKSNMDKVAETFVMYKPKDVVSGDFYWFYDTKKNDKTNDLVYFAAVDCTGHGVPGAFMAMIGNRTLAHIVSENGVREPAAILEEMDEGVHTALKQNESMNNDGMDVALISLRKLSENEFEVIFAGAKRPLYYYSQGALHSIKGGRRSIGGVKNKTKDKPFESHTITCNKGDVIYLTSDGYVDQNCESRERLGSARFESILSEIANKPMEEQLQVLERELAEHQKNEPQRDDITLLGLKL